MSLKDFRLDSVFSEEQSTVIKTYEPKKDLAGLLKQCEVDLREENDQLLYKNWGIPFKESKWCSMKVSNDGENGVKVRFQVDRLDGAIRCPGADSVELAKWAKETQKLLESYVKAVKKCFKEKAGKGLRLKKVKDFDCRYEKIVLNGLYRFVCAKEAYVSGKYENQTFAKDYKDLKSRTG